LSASQSVIALWDADKSELATAKAYG
jgi:hypothetical protein